MTNIDPTQFDSSLIGQRQLRISKAEKLRSLGIEPYPSVVTRSHTSTAVASQFEGLQGQQVTVAGRLMALRGHGKIVFGDLQDQDGRIQIYLKEDELESTNAASQNIGFEHLDLIDIGDLLEVRGEVTQTARGEISILARRIKMLAKAIRPLPDQWSGLKDKELIYRQRYLDMIINPEHRWRFEKGAKLTFAIREFLNSRGFLEIKTPILQPLYGGGNAKPFTTNMNALGVDFFMSISHELYLKRLITAGFENVYNIVGYFRNEGIDRTHNPEFTMLETMSAFHNYEYNMDLIEEMYAYITQKVFEKSIFKINDQEVDFSQPWQRITMIDAVKKYTGYDFDIVKDLVAAHKILDEIGYKKEKPNSIGESMVGVFEHKVEEQLVQPTFLTGHPVEISPLAKRRSDDPRFVERFEIFIGGIEGGDNWTELNDPLELFERFKSQAAKREHGDEEAHPMDVEFIEMMEHGMPPTTGLGPGIERLTMMLTEANYIDEVTFFPIMRPAPVTELQKKIYGEDIFPKQEKTEGIEQHQVKVIKVEALPSREQAIAFVHEYVKDEYQRHHAEMVGVAMKTIAKRFGENEELFELTGLVHDWDFDQWPDEHPGRYEQLQAELGVPDVVVQAIQGHKGLDSPRPTLLAKALFACDEFSGLLYAYMKMVGKYGDMKISSISKKVHKELSFAAKINREDILRGIAEVGIPEEEFYQIIRDAFAQSYD